MLDEVIQHFGGRAALAEKLDVHPAAVTNWKTRGIPLAQAVKIEQLSGGRFKAKDLCPDAYPSPNTGERPDSETTAA